MERVDLWDFFSDCSIHVWSMSIWDTCIWQIAICDLESLFHSCTEFACRFCQIMLWIIMKYRKVVSQFNLLNARWTLSRADFCLEDRGSVFLHTIRAEQMLVETLDRAPCGTLILRNVTTAKRIVAKGVVPLSSQQNNQAKDEQMLPCSAYVHESLQLTHNSPTTTFYEHRVPQPIQFMK